MGKMVESETESDSPDDSTPSSRSGDSDRNHPRQNRTPQQRDDTSLSGSGSWSDSTDSIEVKSKAKVNEKGHSGSGRSPVVISLEEILGDGDGDEIEDKGTGEIGAETSKDLYQLRKELVENYIKEEATGDDFDSTRGRPSSQGDTMHKMRFKQKSPYERSVAPTSKTQLRKRAGRGSKQLMVPDEIARQLDAISGHEEVKDDADLSEPDSEASIEKLHNHLKREIKVDSTKKEKRDINKELERPKYRHPATRDSSKSPRRKKPEQFFYKAQKPVHLMVYRNGDRERNCLIAVSSMDELLRVSTARLSLTSAARKVFLKGGKVVADWDQIVKMSSSEQNDEFYPQLYISSGEPYMNPFKYINESARLGRSLVWNMNGVQLPEDEKRGKTCVRISERLEQLSATNQKRMLILRNGIGMEHSEIVVSGDDFQQFLDSASAVLGLGSPAQKIFDMRGKQLKSLSQIPEVNRSIYNPKGPGQVFGPVWVSKGDSFSGLGGRDFISRSLQSLKVEKKKREGVVEQIELAMGDESSRKDVKMKEFLSMNEDELYERLTQEQSGLEDVKTVIGQLKSALKELQPMIAEEMNRGSRHRMSHIKEWVQGEGRASSLLGRGSLKVVVHENGTDENDEGSVVYYDKDQDHAYQGDMSKFLDHCIASCSKLANPRFSAYSCKAKKLFDQHGNEIGNVKELQSTQHYWISFGEPFMTPIVRAVQLNDNQNNPLARPDVVIAHKVPAKNKASSSQQWVLKKNGEISPLTDKGVCLSVSDETIPWPFISQPGNSQLKKVVLSKKSKSSGQVFRFDSSGFIRNAAHSDLVLTCVSSSGDESVDQRIGFDSSCFFSGLVLCERFPTSSPFAPCQRFALKQETMRGVGEYQKCDIENPAWGKRALTWPVDSAGDFISNLKWPIVAYILCDAPPLSSGKKKKDNFSDTPMRLRVLPNGSCDKQLAAAVMAPDLSQLYSKLNRTKGKKAKGDTGTKREEKTDVPIHCLELTIRQLEFSRFLENCTSILRLPFAARRLFDESGNELTSLANVKRDALVYVTLGDPWIDPGTQTGADLHYLAKFAGDVRAIQHLETLSNFQGLCMEVEGSVLKEGALVKLGRCELSEGKKRELTRTPTPPPTPPKEETEDEMLEKKSVHFRTHYRLQQFENSTEPQWMSHCKDCKNKNTCYVHEHEIPPAPPEPEPEPRLVNYSRNYYKQCFVNSGEFIFCKFNPKLVLSVNEFGRAFLATFNPLEASQKWRLNERGQLCPRSKPDEALTVCMPVFMPGDDQKPDGSELYLGSEIQLQPLDRHEFGSANQKWAFDEKLGFIDAFATDTLDIRLTIANRVGVCSYALNNSQMIKQPGFVLVHSGVKYYLCTACARVLRGTGRKIERLKKPVKFSCDMQPGLPLTKKLRGSFKALSHNVDLSEDNCKETLERLKENLSMLHKQRVSIENKPFSFYDHPKIITVQARSNGTDPNEAAVVLSGASFEQIVSLANTKLGFGNLCGLTYLFGPNGESITNWQELVDLSIDSFANVHLGKHVLRNSDSTSVGNVTFRRSTGDGRDDDLMEDSPSVDLQIRPTTRGVSNGRGSSQPDSNPTPSTSPLLRPPAPEPRLNLIQNGDFEDRDEDSEDKPRHWTGRNGAELSCNFDSDLDCCFCKVECQRKTSAVAQSLSNVLMLNNRYKVTVYVRNDGLDNISFLCSVMFKRTKGAKNETLFAIKADVANDDEWHQLKGFINMPKAEFGQSDSLFDCNIIFALNASETTSFLIAKVELTEDTPDYQSFGPETNLIENGDFKMQNGCSGPAYWLPKNNFTSLRLDKGGCCVEALDQSDDENTFAASYDITYLIEKKNLYKLELKARSLSQPGGTLKACLVCRVSKEKETMTDIAETEVHENSWAQLSSRFSLPKVDHAVESCEIQLTASFPFLFKAPCFFRETNTNQSRPQPICEQDVEDEEKVSGTSVSIEGKDDEVDFDNSNIGQVISIDDLDVNAILANYQLPVFVSKVNKFIHPEEHRAKEDAQKQVFERRRPTGVHLDIEKHKLRLLQGRRINSCSARKLQPTNDPQQPVVVTPAHPEVMEEEVKIGKHVQKLKKNYEALSARKIPVLTKGDYAKPLRVPGKPMSVYRNGEDHTLKENVIAIWASNLDEVLLAATARLKMGFAARKLYRPDGSVVTDFDGVGKHELLCVSQGEPFVNHEDARRKLFLKARWARDKRLGREQPERVILQPNINALAKVDPLAGSGYMKGSDANATVVETSIAFLTQLPVS